MIKERGQAAVSVSLVGAGNAADVTAALIEVIRLEGYS